MELGKTEYSDDVCKFPVSVSWNYCKKVTVWYVLFGVFRKWQSYYTGCPEKSTSFNWIFSV